MDTENIYNNTALRETYSDEALAKVSRFSNPLSVTFTFIGSAKKAQKEGQERFTTLHHKVSKSANKNRYKRCKKQIDKIRAAIRGLEKTDDEIKADAKEILLEKKMSPEQKQSSVQKRIDRNRIRSGKIQLLKTQIEEITEKQLIPCVTAQEFDNATRPHIHVIFDVPEQLKQRQFFNMLKAYIYELFDLRQGVKRDLRFSPKIHYSKFNSAERAVNYLMKQDSKDRNTNFAEFVIA